MYRKWAGISEAIWLLGIAELPKKIDNVHCSGWMRVAGRIVIPCRHKKTTVCSLVCNSSYPIRSFIGKNVAMSIQVNSASHPHREPRQKRIALRPLRAELDKGCLWWNWSQHQCTSKKWCSWETTKGKDWFSLFSFAISESQRKKSLVENCQVLRMTVTFSTTNHLSSTSLWREKKPLETLYLCKNTWCATKAHDDIGSLQNCNGQNTSRIPTNIVGQWLLRAVQRPFPVNNTLISGLLLSVA